VLALLAADLSCRTHSWSETSARLLVAAQTVAQGVIFPPGKRLIADCVRTLRAQM
jgi:hypothetical protein